MRIDLLAEYRGLLDILLPPCCPVCGRDFAPARDGLCHDCQTTILPLPAARCPACAHPYPTATDLSHLCGRCAISRPSFHSVHALGVYHSILRKAIQALKYRRAPLLGKALGVRLAAAVREQWQPPSRPVVAAVPLHPSRLRERGFNQSLLLARALGRKLGWPVYPGLLSKPVATPLQQHLDARQRAANLRGAIVAGCQLHGESVLLVDDVMTTGATAQVCTEALLDAGAAQVSLAVVARADRLRETAGWEPVEKLARNESMRLT